MHVPQLLDALPFGVDIEIVVSRLPESSLPALNRHRQLEALNRLAQHAPFRLADEQVHMLWHHHISADKEVMPYAHGLQRAEEDVPCSRRYKVRLSAIATESHKVQVARLLVSSQALRHGHTVTQVSEARPWGTRIFRWHLRPGAPANDNCKGKGLWLCRESCGLWGFCPMSQTRDMGHPAPGMDTS